MSDKCCTCLPIYVVWIPFAKYSTFPTNGDDKGRQLQPRRKHIILARRNETDEDHRFCELIHDKDTDSINCKSFENDYNKKLASLNDCGLHDVHYADSYIVGNNKYCIVFEKWYNVYDMENDKWLINQNEKQLTKNGSRQSRSVMINDEMIIISHNQTLSFYFIGNNCLTNPLLTYVYKLKTQNVSFWFHGMCVIDFQKVEKKGTSIECSKDEEESCQTYTLKIVLFGGYKMRDFLSSFLFLDVLLSYVPNENSCKVVNLSIDEKVIDKNKIQLQNMGKLRVKRLICFGFECMLNWKDEPVIIIAGGDDTQSFGKRDIFLFNCVTYQVTCKKQVLLNCIPFSSVK